MYSLVFVPLLNQEVSNVSYLGYREPIKLLDDKQENWVTILHGGEGEDAMFDMEYFYHRLFILTGKYSPVLGQIPNINHRGHLTYLHRDNHDGFTFELKGMGHYMIFYHDGSFSLYRKANCSCYLDK